MATDGSTIVLTTAVVLPVRTTKSPWYLLDVTQSV